MARIHNIPVRNAAEKNNLYLYEVADIMGLSYSAFMQRIRKEWSEDEQQRVIRLIEGYVSRKGSDHGRSEE